MYVGSLFSGIGGIELGFEREGFETRWFVEIDEYCQRVLRKYWPNVPIYGDIRTVDFSRLERVDILTGGFPCQDISTANPRGKGIEGERSGLWSYYKEAIRVLRPKYAVIENVPNLLGWFDIEARPEMPEPDLEGREWQLDIEQHQALQTILIDLAEIGYDAEWNAISARGVGARHLRSRIFIVAYPCGRGTGDNFGAACGAADRETVLRQGGQTEAGRIETAGTDVANPFCGGCGQAGERRGLAGMDQRSQNHAMQTEEPDSSIPDVAHPCRSGTVRQSENRALRGNGRTVLANGLQATERAIPCGNGCRSDVADTARVCDNGCGCELRATEVRGEGQHSETRVGSTKLANTYCGGIANGTAERIHGRNTTLFDIGKSRADVPNPASARLEGCEPARELFRGCEGLLAECRARNQRGIWRVDPADLPDTENGGSGTEYSSLVWRYRETSGEDGSWSTEPYVGRVAYGVPKRVDRLRCLGNAVVPQVAQVIARRIKEIDCMIN
jgi:site-specific DNA-cytosine methylase